MHAPIRKLAYRTIVVAALLAAACGRPEFGTPTSAGGDVVGSDVDRDQPSPPAAGDDGAPPADEEDDGEDDRSPDEPPTDGGVGAGPDYAYAPGGEFAFSVYHALAAEAGNAVFAPHGLARSLVIVHAAADAATAQQVESVLSYYVGWDVYSGFNDVDLSLAARSDESLQLVGSIWAQQGVNVSEEFVDTLGRYLGIGVRLVDFASSAADARVAINNWHSDHTMGRITEVLAPRAVDESTRLLITDAIWFSGVWAFGGFDPAATEYATFQGTESTVEVPMMRTSGTFDVLDGPDFDAVVLPYEDDFSLLAIVPDDLLTFEEGLHPEFFARLQSEMVPMNAQIRFPRVEISDRVALSRVTDALGLGSVLDDAEYPAFLDGWRIEDAHQRTRIVFHEEGTDAESDDPSDSDDAREDPNPAAGAQLSISFDRPFLFAITDSASGRLLFVGRVAQP